MHKLRTVVSASQPTYNNDYIGTTPDPDLSDYVPNSASDKDIITQSRYDAVGNLVQTIDPLGISSFTVYDVLNRPVKTVRSAKTTATVALNPGDAGYSAANDPRVSGYVVSTAPDRDLIETTMYDALGRVVRTQRLLENRLTASEWETTLYGFDPLGRQVKVVRIASQPDYDLTADTDLSAYVASTDPDRDIVTITAYDVQGRVMYTEDTLGQRTWTAYDGLSRAVKTIANAVGTAIDGGVNDGLGSVRGVVSNAGSVLEHRHFDPFGNLYAGTMAQTDFGFTGEQFDSATGLLYLRARLYRPGIGSFVSRDPFEGMMARPMSRNGYRPCYTSSPTGTFSRHAA